MSDFLKPHFLVRYVNIYKTAKVMDQMLNQSFSQSLWALFTYERLSSHSNAVKISKLNKVPVCWWSFCYLLVFSLLIMTNNVMIEFCQPWDDDFPACNTIPRVVKTQWHYKICTCFQGSSFLPAVPPAVLAYVSIWWWCRDAAGAFNDAPVLIMC